MRIVLPLLCVGALASLAQAQPSTSAETLFREGKSLMTQGKVAEACNAFEGSYRKDPATSTLLNVADCREKNKQYATAWAAFVEVERRSRGSGDAAQVAINTLAKERAAKLEPRISYLTDQRARRGARRGPGADPRRRADRRRRVEPLAAGRHRRAQDRRQGPGLRVVEHDRHDRQRAREGRDHDPALQAAAQVPRCPTPGRGRSTPSPFTAKRKLAIGLGGVGVVGAGVGIWLYVTAKGQYDDAKLEPDDAKQKPLWDSANQKYLIAQIAGGVGVAALGTAAFLWFTGKPAVVERPELAITPSIGPGGAGFVAVGTF
jgi:hypothetical protein